MKKVKATHTITRAAARFGVPDPVDVCSLVAKSFPLECLREDDAILDLGQGCCGISRSIVKRLVSEVYSDHYDAMFRVHGIENDLALVKKAQRLGFVNTVCTDVEDFNPGKKYKVIVGNPPYSNPDKAKKAANGRSANGTPLWVKFIKRATELLSEGGFLVLLVPAAVATPGSRGMKAAKGLKLVSVTFGMERYFNVGTDIALVVWEKTEKERDLLVNGMAYPKDLPIANVSSEEDLLRLKAIWSGNSPWKYMDNRGHSQRVDTESILVVRRMYSGDEFVFNYGLDLSRFDRESLVGLEGVSSEKAKQWSEFFQSANGKFLRRVTNYAGNISAHFLKLVNPLSA